MDLTSYLLGKNSSSGGGGGGTTPTTLDELNQVIRDFFTNIPNTYTTKTTESVTLYTPDVTYQTYAIQKRSNGNYRILWLPTNSGACMWNRSSLYLGSIYCDMTDGDVSTLTLVLTSTNKALYYSSELSTVEACIEAIQSNSTSYTKGSAGSYSGVADTPYILPCCNGYVIDDYNGTASLVASQRISKNEIIQVIS